jgi:hypothetical protein
MASRRLQVSVTRAEHYVDVNPSRDGKRKRTKVCINTVRHLDSDSTTDGAIHFTWLQASEGIAKLVVFGSTLTGEYQVPCRVGGVTLTPQESIPKLLATTFRSDPVGTDYDLTPCQPGFVNSTYDSSCLIIVKCLGDSTSNPGHFRLDIVAENALLCPVQFHRDSCPKGGPMPTRSWWDLAKICPVHFPPWLIRR